MRSYLQILNSTLPILIVGVSATRENVLDPIFFITRSFGSRATCTRSPDRSRFIIRVAMMSTQEGWHRGSTNTEPGAAATGCNLQYTNRSMREFRDEHSRLVVNRVAGRSRLCIRRPTIQT